VATPVLHLVTLADVQRISFHCATKQAHACASAACRTHVTPLLRHAGVEGLQRQFVCYGDSGTAEEAPQGWKLARSDPAAVAAAAAGRGGYGGDALEMSLSIVTAPAEFGVPLKQDRQFTPPFKVQARPRRCCRRSVLCDCDCCVALRSCANPGLVFQCLPARALASTQPIWADSDVAQRAKATLR
jgi:hypothetical protein